MGHRISQGGGGAFHDSQVCKQKIKEWPIPKTSKEVAMFLGFTGYYRTFKPQYSALTNRLTGIKKAKKFGWNKEIE